MEIFFRYFFSYKLLLHFSYNSTKVSIKYNPEHKIIRLSSIAKGFFNITTAEMVNDLKDSHARRPLPPNKSSHQLSIIIENPSNESPDNSDDPTHTPSKPSGFLSPPFFHTKGPKRNPKMTQYKLFPKRKSSFKQSTKNDITTYNTSKSCQSVF